MSWIVLGEEKNKIKLVSKKPGKNEIPGLLPRGSFLTVESDNKESKYILRVDDSFQYEPFSPSPMIIDMELKPLYEDRKCQNIIYATRVKDVNKRKDFKIDFILPQSIARRATQDEVNIAMGGIEEGPKVFLATIHSSKNQLLVDDKLQFITANLPEEMFWHQMLICGKTGSGKTVAIKYLAQYFVEKMRGAVLAINVKEKDLLKMDKPSEIKNDEILNEWNVLGEKAHGIETCTIYYPANTTIRSYRGINLDICQKITFKVKDIEPESLIGILQNISEIGAQSFPDIFRYWQERERKDDHTFGDFVKYFRNGEVNPLFESLNVRGNKSPILLHRGTFQNILRNLINAEVFFDNVDARALDYDDILVNNKLSVINVTGDRGIQFGSILLRHLLKRIVRAKSYEDSDVPILIIIDEVHRFYHTEASKEALDDLDTICRTGRSQEISVIFSSQNENDIPKGLSKVINSKIFFKSDSITNNTYGISNNEIQSLEQGYAVCNIHNLSQLKILKFPLSFAGVFE